MARQESHREDLIGEAVALVRRIELQLDEEPTSVVVGFRRDGSASIFFGQDPVVQWNSHKQLRRGYYGGVLLKAEQGRLSSLTRVRTPTETQLVRHDLTAQETDAFLKDVERRLARLRIALEEGRCAVLRQVPDDENVLNAVKEWLAALEFPLAIASAPSAG